MGSAACRGVGDENWRARREREKIGKKIDFFIFSRHLTVIPIRFKSLLPKPNPLAGPSWIERSQRFKKLAGGLQISVCFEQNQRVQVDMNTWGLFSNIILATKDSEWK